MEVWKDVIGYEGLYSISNYGNVKSLQYHGIKREKIMKIGRFKSGYLNIGLYNKGKYKLLRVHRLVYETFVGKIPNGMTVNHKDENKENNKLENLELLSVKDNDNYGTRNKRMADGLSKKVYQYSLKGELIKIWRSTMDCKRNNLHNGVIIKCCHNKYGKRNNVYKGFVWSYSPIKEEQFKVLAD